MAHKETISPKSRGLLCFAAWIFAYILVVIPNLGLASYAIVFAWMFPFGVLRLVSGAEKTFGRGFEALFPLGCWIFFGYLTFLAASQSRKVRFFFIYSALCIVLALTVVGCHEMMNDPLNYLP